jgi:hypothetical protein
MAGGRPATQPSMGVGGRPVASQGRPVADGEWPSSPARLYDQLVMHADRRVLDHEHMASGREVRRAARRGFAVAVVLRRGAVNDSTRPIYRELVDASPGVAWDDPSSARCGRRSGEVACGLPVLLQEWVSGGWGFGSAVGACLRSRLPGCGFRRLGARGTVPIPSAPGARTPSAPVTGTARRTSCRSPAGSGAWLGQSRDWRPRVPDPMVAAVASCSEAGTRD